MPDLLEPSYNVQNSLHRIYQLQTLLKNDYSSYVSIFPDPRTENWWMMSGPGPLLTLLVTYLYFCISVGPRYMRDRKPYDLKNTIIVYNVSQILMSIFLVYEVNSLFNCFLIIKGFLVSFLQIFFCESRSSPYNRCF